MKLFMIRIVIIMAILLGITACGNTSTTTTTISPSGVRLSFNYQPSILSEQIDESDYRRQVPRNWITEDTDNARYTVSFSFDLGTSRDCSGYESVLSDETVTLTYQEIDTRITITDRFPEGNPTIARRNFSATLPSECPFSYEFETVDLVAQDAIEYYVSDTAGMRTWIVENLGGLTGIPTTATPNPTNTNSVTVTATTPRVTSANSIPTSPATATRMVDNGRLGLVSAFSYENETLSEQIRESVYRTTIQPSWLASSAETAHYEITFDFTLGTQLDCGEADGIMFQGNPVQVFLQQVELTVTINDLVNADDLLLSQEFEPSPASCPISLQISDNDLDESGVYTEYILPETQLIRDWLSENAIELSGLPATPTPLPTSTPIENRIIAVFDDVIIRDSENQIIGTATQGQLPLIRITDGYYVVIYEGEEAYIQRNSPNAIVAEAIEDATLAISGFTNIRVRNNEIIGTERAGEFPIFAITDEHYVIDYNGELGYVPIDSLSVTLIQASSSNPPTTDISDGTPIPNDSGRFGVTTVFDYEDEDIANLINERDYFNAIPARWRAIGDDIPRYEIVLYFNNGNNRQYCGEYGSIFEDDSFILNLQAVDVTILVSDLTLEENTLLISHNIESEVPEICPFTYTATTDQLELGEVIDWHYPEASAINLWLRENITEFDDIPASPTPRPTTTPRPTVVATAFPEDRTITVSGTVVLRDEGGRSITTITEGAFSWVRTVGDNYEIIYNGEPAYIRSSSRNVTTSTDSNVVLDNNLIITGTVIVRDVNGEVVGVERSGTFQIVSLTDNSYVIQYNGDEAFIPFTESNAMPERPISADN